MVCGASSRRLCLFSSGASLVLASPTVKIDRLTDAFGPASISGTDLLEEVLPAAESWRTEDTVRLAPILAEHGVDLLDVSSGGISNLQTRGRFPGFQVPFAEAVKKAHGDKLLVSAVGAIDSGKLAQSILDEVRLFVPARCCLIDLTIPRHV